jgi:NAD+ kinase
MPKVNNLTYKRERDLTPEDYVGKSLVISLGGDGCFLGSCSMVVDPELPMLGINTDPGRSLGILCGKFIYKQRSQKKHIEKIFTQIEEQKYTWLYRQRIMLQIDRYDPKQGENHIKQLCLNEAFVSEKDPSKISVYNLFANQQSLGKFRSSGILASTGTGSSGWLYGAKRMTSYNVRAIINELKSHYENTENEHLIEVLRDGHLLDDELANQISSETHFQAEKESMYYFVREPKVEESFNEGFAEELVIESELGDG